MLLFLIHIMGRMRTYNYKKWRVIHNDCTVCYLQLVFASALAAIPFLELNGKLGADNKLAPHEMISIALSIVSWTLFAVQLAMERAGNYVVEGRWTTRFAVQFMASAEVVKLRMLVLSHEDSNLTYFDVLYYAYVVLQVLLAGGRVWLL